MAKVNNDEPVEAQMIPEIERGEYFYKVIAKTPPELVLATDGEAVSCSLGEITCYTNCVFPLDLECRLISVARDYSTEQLGVNVALIQAMGKGPEQTGLVRYVLNPANTDNFEVTDREALSSFLHKYVEKFDQCVENFALFAGKFCSDEAGYGAVRRIWSPGEAVTPELWMKIMEIRDDYAVRVGYRRPNRKQRLKARGGASKA